MRQPTDEERAAFGRIVARSWDDETYRAKFLGDPRTTLAEAGIDVPADLVVKVTEQKPGEMHLVLPPTPALEGVLSDEELEQVAGGICCCCTCCCTGYSDIGPGY